jgi:rRNA small subunit pseudouridine methyltransferase Nep1
VLVHLVFAEAALELIPGELRRSAPVLSDARSRRVDPSRILLDRSLHHRAMLRLADDEKRGRPDLVHASLLSVTGTPLFLRGLLRVYVHTNQNTVLEIKERTRIPKNYFRFRGLAEQLLAERPRGGLVKVYSADLEELLKNVIASDLVVGLSTQGATTPPEELARMISEAKKPCLLIGGFPHGHFHPKTLRLTDKLVRIDEMPLESHVVAARVVYEIEKALGRAND